MRETLRSSPPPQRSAAQRVISNPIAHNDERSEPVEKDDDERYKQSYESTSINGQGREPALRDAEKRDPESQQSFWQQRRQGNAKEDPFGDEEDADVKYRTMKWWQAAMIMIAETISLGILSLPSVLKTVGLVPGIILIAGLGLLATYTGFVIGQFKLAYPHVHNMADAGEVLAGPIGREVGGAAQTIFLIFTMGSHVLTFTIALNNITDHGTCTIVFSIVGTILLWIFSIPRTMQKVSYLSIASFISIFSAVLITMIALGISPSPNIHLAATAHPTFAKAFLSVTNIIFAYAGHVSFFSFISEFKDPTEYPKALYLLQATDTTMYIIVAVVVYRYAGDDVSSPALGSAGNVVRKVAYGIALPTIVIAGVIYAHVASKYVYVRLFRGTKHMSKRTLLSVGTWLLIITIFWIIAWIIAESIPNFNDLLSLISSIFASWFTYGLSGVFWLFINKGQWWSSPRKIALTILNSIIVMLGAAIMGMGLYASGLAIHDNSGSGSWSCADNSKGS